MFSVKQDEQGSDPLSLSGNFMNFSYKNKALEGVGIVDTLSCGICNFTQVSDLKSNYGCGS